jgi:hypothetical protein
MFCDFCPGRGRGPPCPSSKYSPAHSLSHGLVLTAVRYFTLYTPDSSHRISFPCFQERNSWFELSFIGIQTNAEIMSNVKIATCKT